MSKPVNLKKISTHWNKVKEETILICVEHKHCTKCPFHMHINHDIYCLIGRLNDAMEKLKDTPNFVQVELPELIVNEERGEKK